MGARGHRRDPADLILVRILAGIVLLGVLTMVVEVVVLHARV